MDVGFIITVNLMLIAAVAIVASALNRQDGFLGWAVANGAVLAVGIVSLAWAPAWAPWLATAVFVPFVLGPVLLTRLAVRRSQAGDTAGAARFSHLAARLHPAPRTVANAQLAAALAADDAGADAQGLRALVATVPPEQAVPAKVLLAAREQDWSAVLELVQRAPAGVQELKALEIRALGELGQIARMLEVYRAARPRLAGPQGHQVDLFVLVYGGRPQGVAALLERPLRVLPPEAKHAWLAIAAAVVDPQDPVARSVLQRLAAEADKPSIRRAAARRLASPARQPILADRDTALLAALEARVQRDGVPARRSLAFTPVTLVLCAAYAVAFGLEMSYGGSENLATLVDLGALWPPYVLERGEWWRLLAATFLHYGILHFALNTVFLVSIGPRAERQAGSTTYLAIYLAGAIGSSAVYLLLAANGYVRQGVLVGASGALFAIFGLEAARMLLTWALSRDLGDRQELVTIGIAIVAQFIIDLSVPEISLTVHAAGFAIGALLGLLLYTLRRAQIRSA